MIDQHEAIVQRVAGGAVALGFLYSTEVGLGAAGRADLVVYSHLIPGDPIHLGAPVAVVEVKNSLRNVGQRRRGATQALRYAKALSVPGWLVGPTLDFVFGAPGSTWANGITVGPIEDLFAWLRVLTTGESAIREDADSPATEAGTALRWSPIGGAA